MALLLALVCSAPAAHAIPTEQDADGDGVADVSDAFPCDPGASAEAFAPGEAEHGLVLFEDQWPHHGDIDYNDVALSYHYRVRLDAAGRAVGVRATYNVRALGGSLPVGFGLHLPVARQDVASVTRMIGVRGPDGAWVDGVAEPLLPLEADAELTVVISPYLRELFEESNAPINANPDEERRIGAPFVVDLSFTTPRVLALGQAPFDLFIFSSTDNGREIHLPAYAGTSRMNTALFGTESDDSGPGHWFKDDRGLPAALIVPSNAPYPLEAVEISALFPRIVGFASSGGLTDQDFYTTPDLGAAYADVQGRPAPEPAPVLRTTPEPFCFGPIVDAPFSTELTSRTVSLRGFAGPLNVGVSGAGAPTISVNGGPWVSAVDGVRAPATLSVRQYSDAQPGVQRDADVTAGAALSRWSVTTISVPVGQPSNPGVSCRDVRAAGGGTSNGLYWLQDGAGGSYQAYCNMTADGGGWTAMFSGTNGTPHVFDGFERSATTCTDLSSRCIRRPPSGLNGTRVELAVECGSAMVAFPMTNPMWSWLSQGTRASWVSFSGARAISSGVDVLPNSVYTGSGGDDAFVFARNQGTGGNTFASTYPGSGSYNYCDGSSNTSARVRVYYRERAPVPIHNLEADARVSCRRILDSGESHGDGVYWLRQEGGPAYQAYCNMTLDGGGWTAMLAGQNGNTAVFDRFDDGRYAGICTDPATRCLRRAPAHLIAGQTEIAVALADVAVRFPLTSALHGYFTRGTQAGWQVIDAQSIGSGNILVRPNRVWTGATGDTGLIFAVNNSTSYVFGASYGTNASWSSGNLSFDTGSPLYVMYRESAPPVDPLALGTSCRDIRDRGLGVGDGVYRLQEPGRSSYSAYCDMSTDGGGWTAAFSGTNGTPHVFDGFDDVTRPAATCTSVSTRCVHRPPPTLNGTRTEVMVECGSARVAFPMTTPIYNHLVGGQASGWTNFTGARNLGNAHVLPNTWYAGTAGERGFIVSRNQGTGGNTFGSSFAGSSSYNYCDGSSNTSARLRIYYREQPVVEPLNAESNALASCRAILDAGQSLGSGNYWIRPDAQGVAVRAYCDMTLDGGGWTTVFAGQNGAMNVFDRFDEGAHSGVCTDPATRCVRRAPNSLSTADTEIAVEVGNLAYRFPMTAAVRGYLVSGTQSGWAPIAAHSIGSGAVVVRPTALYTGSGTNYGFIAAAQNSSSYVFASSYGTNTSFDSANLGYDVSSLLRVMYREGAPPVDPAALGTSCLDVLRRGRAGASGVYRLQQPGRSSYDAYCDMTTDGGGWTAMYSGTNGTPHVFDGFDDRTRPSATCTSVSSRCVTRPPPDLNASRAELAVACGSAMVAMPLTSPLYRHFALGESVGWQNMTGVRAISSGVDVLPNSYYGGTGSDRGFVFARNQGTGGNTFASSYAGSSSYNYCDGASNTSAAVRVFYRESTIGAALNAPANPPLSCRAILDAGASQGDGNYWIQPAGSGAPVMAYCDMTLDGGGWTTLFAGQNGAMNVFDGFDAGVHQGVCTDPATRCLRRAPASLVPGSTDVAAAVGSVAVRFPLTSAVLGYLANGTIAGWQPIAAESIGSGDIVVRPNAMFTGSASDRGFIIAVSGQTSYVFGSSFPGSTSWDSANRSYDVSSPLRLMYREGPPPTDPAAEGSSCEDIRVRGQSRGSGLYTLQQAGGSAYVAYCDMVSNGGGWTAIWSGTNGSPHVFDAFDGVERAASTCSDVASRCVRRPPTSITSGETQIAVSCGARMVRFTLTPQLRDYLLMGSRQGWISLPDVSSIGASAASVLPNTLYTGSGGDPSFIFSRSSGSGGNTFAASYAGSASFNYCDGSSNNSSRVQLFYR